MSAGGLPNRLRAAREQAGLTQGQVAKLLGVHRPTVSEMEAGGRRVRAEELPQLAKIYRVSVSWLAGDDEASDDGHDAKVQLAARELGKLKPGDLDRVMSLLTQLRQSSEKPKKR
jgi:transcriptional regulator with XRE-family HTH domain